MTNTNDILTIPVTPEMREELYRIAVATGSSPEGVAAEVIQDYIKLYHQHAAIIAERLERDRSGQAMYIDHDMVMTQVEALLNKSHQ